MSKRKSPYCHLCCKNCPFMGKCEYEWLKGYSKEELALMSVIIKAEICGRVTDNDMKTTDSLKWFSEN